MAELAPETLHVVDAPVILVVAPPQRQAEYRALAVTSGGRVADTVPPHAAADRLARQVRLDAILFDAEGMEPDAAGDLAEVIAQSAAAHGAGAVVMIDRACIDTVAGSLIGSGIALLCDAAPAEREAALRRAFAPVPAQLHDATRERESERLRLLNEEVARLAEVLSQLAAEQPSGVRDRAGGYRSEQVDEADPEPRTVRSAIRARRLRDQHFPAELFADPAWDMLLDLYAARLEGRRVSVSSLCIAAAVPPTTALRWIGTMHEAGLFGREPDPTDKRRAHITLTDRAARAMRGYFGAVARAGLVAG